MPNNPKYKTSLCCSHGVRDLVAITPYLAYCKRCKQHIKVRLVNDLIAKKESYWIRLMRQSRRPYPEGIGFGENRVTYY